ncbi:MAG: elongation factor 1-beta [Candidatus Woesearchaeota archaeon]
MANAIATIKIMPDSPDVDMDKLQETVNEKIKSFTGSSDTKTEIEPIAFGLKALKVTFVMDEQLGSPDSLEEDITALEGVNSFEVIDVRRAVG